MATLMDDDKVSAMFDMVKENNRMLKAMRREAFIGGIFKIVWWVLAIVVIPYIIYIWYLQPYLDQLLSTYEQVQGQSAQAKDALDRIQELNNTSGFSKLLEQFGIGGGQ